MRGVTNIIVSLCGSEATGEKGTGVKLLVSVGGRNSALCGWTG